MRTLIVGLLSKSGNTAIYTNIGGMCDIIVQRSGSIAKEAMFSRIPGCTETC